MYHPIRTMNRDSTEREDDTSFSSRGIDGTEVEITLEEEDAVVVETGNTDDSTNRHVVSLLQDDDLNDNENGNVPQPKEDDDDDNDFNGNDRKNRGGVAEAGRGRVADSPSAVQVVVRPSSREDGSCTPRTAARQRRTGAASSRRQQQPPPCRSPIREEEPGMLLLVEPPARVADNYHPGNHFDGVEEDKDLNNQARRVGVHGQQHVEEDEQQQQRQQQHDGVDVSGPNGTGVTSGNDDDHGNPLRMSVPFIGAACIPGPGVRHACSIRLCINRYTEEDEGDEHYKHDVYVHGNAVENTCAIMEQAPTTDGTHGPGVVHSFRHRPTVVTNQTQMRESANGDPCEPLSSTSAAAEAGDNARIEEEEHNVLLLVEPPAKVANDDHPGNHFDVIEDEDPNNEARRGSVHGQQHVEEEDEPQQQHDGVVVSAPNDMGGTRRSDEDNENPLRISVPFIGAARIPGPGVRDASRIRLCINRYREEDEDEEHDVYAHDNDVENRAIMDPGVVHSFRHRPTMTNPAEMRESTNDDPSEPLSSASAAEAGDNAHIQATLVDPEEQAEIRRLRNMPLVRAEALSIDSKLLRNCVAGVVVTVLVIVLIAAIFAASFIVRNKNATTTRTSQECVVDSDCGSGRACAYQYYYGVDARNSSSNRNAVNTDQTEKVCCLTSERYENTVNGIVVCGGQSTGASCFRNAMCASQICSSSSSNNNNNNDTHRDADGTCQASVGAECSDHSECSTGACGLKDVAAAAAAESFGSSGSRMVCCQDNRIFQHPDNGLNICGSQAEGAACYTNGMCTSRVCMEKTCRADKQTAGEFCEDHPHCVSNYCVENTCRECIIDKSELRGAVQTPESFFARFGQPIGGWCVSNVDDFSDLFTKDVNIDDRPSTTVHDTRYDYSYQVSRNSEASKLDKTEMVLFNQDISGWNVSGVKNMTRVFYNESLFNQDIGEWDVSNVVDFRMAFSFATSFNRDIGNWNLSGCRFMGFVFENATSFNQDLGQWDVSNVRDMESTFISSASFNGDIRAWDVSSVDGMTRMFANAVAFNQDIRGWNVSGTLIDMSGMFSGATSFNQNLCQWRYRLDPAVNVYGMFKNTGCPNQSDPVVPIGPFCYNCA